MTAVYQVTQRIIRAKLIHIPADWQWCLTVWGISRLILASWGVLLWVLKMIPLPGLKGVYMGVTPITNGIAAPFLGVWQRWDVIHYFKIAANGYYTQNLSAFFPLFPLLGRFVGWLIGGNYLVGLMLVSNISLLLGLILLYQIVAENFSVQAARSTTIILITFPAAFYFYAGYPSALILLLSLILYRAARRERWFLVSCVGILAGLTHSTAWPLMFLLAPLVIQSWKKGPAFRRLPVFLVLLTPLLGIGLFLAWRISQGFMDFMTLQSQDWGKSIVPLWMILPMAIKENYFTFRIWLNLGIFIIAITLIPFVWKKMDWGMALFLLSSSLFLATNANYGEPLPSFFRYVLPIFPLFIALALLFRKNVHWLAILFAAIQLLLCGFFLMWLWVG